MKREIEENIWQVLRIDEAGRTRLHSWHAAQSVAEAELEKSKELFEFENVWIEKGTDYISSRCQGCGTIYAVHRYDLNGIRRGFWCLDCYKSDDVFIWPKGENHGAQFDSLTNDDD